MIHVETESKELERLEPVPAATVHREGGIVADIFDLARHRHPIDVTVEARLFSVKAAPPYRSANHSAAAGGTPAASQTRVMANGRSCPRLSRTSPSPSSACRQSPRIRSAPCVRD